MKSLLNKISSSKFEKMILEYWELTNLFPLKNRLFREFKETWSWFWQNHGINKKQFNELFLRLLEDNRKFLNLHGSPTGSYNDNTALVIPDDVEKYSNHYARKRWGIWSIDTSNTRINDWSGKPQVKVFT